MERSKKSYIDGAIEKLESVVKHGKPKLRRKKVKSRVLKKPTRLKRKHILKKARLKAHSNRADAFRKQSKEIRDNFL